MTEEIVLQPPPALPRSGGGNGAQQLMFLLPMTIGMGVMSFVYIGRVGGAGMIVFGVLFAVVLAGVLIMGLSRGGLAKRAQINDERRDYLRYLDGLRDGVRRTAARQRAEANAQLPGPDGLWALAGTPLMWSRRPRHDAFGRVRIGTGPQRLATALRAPQTAPLADLDPVCSTSLRHFIRAYATVDDLPVAVSLRAFTRVTLAGDPDRARALARAMVAHLAALHGPGDLRIAVCAAAEHAAEWSWVKWLPHVAHPAHADAAGPTRLCTVDPAGLAAMLAGDLAGRPPFQQLAGAPAGSAHLVVITDLTVTGNSTIGGYVPGEGLAGVTILAIGAPAAPHAEQAATTLELIVADGRLGMRRPAGTTLVGRPDQLGIPETEALARRLAPWHPPAARTTRGTAPTGLAELLGLGDPRRLDPAVSWRPRPARERLRLPIGAGPDGVPVELDLKESAEGGMGPHGLVIGATGSGKSELLRTLVTGLVATHSSETLNLALVDFKGGATFTGMAGLPHTCAVITNLSAELSLVDRMGDALRGELVRRQELLRAAGNFASVRDYERARAAGADLTPLPSLLVIIDEFTELLAERPEFTELFVMIGRIGRSLAIHLLLASQRLEEGRLRGLDSHLSYRIGLRTFSAAESRTVLGVPDAHELPAEPGAGYLRVDTTTLLRFKAAYVSGPVATVADHRSGAARPVPVAFTVGPVAAVEAPAPVAGDDGTGESTMDALIRRLAGKGPAAHRIWLPPLDEPPALGDLIAEAPPLHIPVAIVDKPYEQRRDPYWIDLSGAGGHAVVVGAPQSGKSTLLRTIVCALALTHTPRQVQFMLLDLGGGGLSALAGLPHVSGVAVRQDPERLRRTVAELGGLLAQREELFRAHGVDSITAFRANPPPSPDGREFGDVFLVVDGWLTLRQEFEPLAEAVQTLAARGLGFGIHVVLSVNRWSELRPATRDVIGTTLELRLGDPSDSSVGRKAAAAVPERPGRGLTRDGLHFLAALPRAGGDLAGLVADVAGAWDGPPAPPVRLLPRLIAAADLPPGAGRQIAIGLDEQHLAPVTLDFDADPHLLVLGDTESGKTALLRLICDGIQRRYAAEDAAVLVVDYRRGMLDAVTGRHLLAYAGSQPVLTPAIADVVRAMRARLPGPEVTADQLRARSWWTGPELFVVADDYDLIANPGGNPLAALAELLPQARDIGLHLIVARRTGGAARALFEPLLQRMRDVGTPGVVLSGSREEGVLLGGVKAVPRPPGQGEYAGRRGAPRVLQTAWLEVGKTAHPDPGTTAVPPAGTAE